MSTNTIIVTTKKDLAAKASELTGVSRKQATDVINAVFASIEETLKDGGEVSISGFGKWVVSERPEKTGVNPATGKKITIPSAKVAKFKVSKHLKDAVNQ